MASAAGIVAGVAPALGALRVNVLDQLKAGSRGTTGQGRTRLRSVFAVSQISLAVALVVGAALMSKGMFSMLHLADDYHPGSVLVFNVTYRRRVTIPRKSRRPGIARAWNACALCRV